MAVEGAGCLVTGVPLRPGPVFAFIVVLPELVVVVGEAVVEEVQRLEECLDRPLVVVVRGAVVGEVQRLEERSDRPASPGASLGQVTAPVTESESPDSALKAFFRKSPNFGVEGIGLGFTAAVAPTCLRPRTS